MNITGANMKTARIPNFFIIGAPKAGTTALYTYLAAHPQVFMPRLKEPFYFCSDFPAYRERATSITDTTKYLKLFAQAKDRHIVCGEASSLYLISKVAVPAILELNPDAHIIAMLRNPVDLVHSFHSQLVYSLHESVNNFEQAWRLQEVRAQGRHIPKDCLETSLLQYRQVGMLGEQVARLLKHVCRSRIKILFYDDLVASPGQLYEEVLSFLHLSNDSRLKFSKVNANKVRRIPPLTRMLRHPPFPLNILRDWYLRHVGVDTWLMRLVARLNSRQVARTPLSLELRRELEAEFHDDIRLLESLVGRDLSHWVPPRSGQFASQAA
jgi:hypothetical protein